MIQITQQMIDALAPNPAASSNARKISQKGGFIRLERSADETFYLGECTGSGSSQSCTARVGKKIQNFGRQQQKACCGSQSIKGTGKDFWTCTCYQYAYSAHDDKHGRLNNSAEFCKDGRNHSR